MADETKIAWCDSTFNCWIGCTKVSPGCDNCYAAAQDAFRKWTPAGWGAGQPRKRTQTWGDPVKWNAKPFYECLGCGKQFSFDREGIVTCANCKGELVKSVRRRVFCASLADVFDNEVDPEWRADLFDLIAKTPNLDWLLLTKRIGNAAAMIRTAVNAHWRAEPAAWPWPNVWLGATVVNQEEAERDIPKLLATPARVRFLSMEPLLRDVDLSQWLFPFQPCKNCPCPNPDVSREGIDRCCCDPELMPSELSWVIVGGESGPGARPMHPDWARSLRDQCAAAGVQFLLKQWGEWIPESQQERSKEYPGIVADGAHGCPANGWPEPRVHRWADCSQSYRCGKKAAGRLLDGVEHNGFPEAR